MRSHLPWLTTGMIGLALSASSALAYPSAVGAQDETTPTTVLGTEVDQTMPELAPGESPDGNEIDSGPVLTLVIPEPSTTDVVPAGPVVFDPTPSNLIDDNTKTAVLLLILAAVPSLTVGTALWVHRDRGPVRRH